MLMMRPKNPVHHSVDSGMDQRDRRDHVALERPAPIIQRKILKITGRRAAGIVDQDVWRRAGFEDSGSSGI